MVHVGRTCMNDNLFEGVEIRRGALLAGADDVVTIAIAAGRSAAEALAFVSAVPGPWRVLEAEILSQVLRCEMGTQRFAAVFLASALEWSGVDPVAARAAYRLAELLSL
ncbi:MAG: hypothetical protein ABMB14_34965, partial [Myxococcota bacterium]